MFLGLLKPMNIKYEEKKFHIEKNYVSKNLFYLCLWHSSVEQQKIPNDSIYCPGGNVLFSAGTQKEHITQQWKP